MTDDDDDDAIIVLDDDSMTATSPTMVVRPKGSPLFVDPQAPDTKTATPSGIKASTPKGQRGNQPRRRQIQKITTTGVTSATPGDDLGRDLEFDELHAMEMQVEAQQQKLREKKERYKKRQQQQMHVRADELQNRLKALEEAEKQERRVRLEMRTKLTGLREHDAEDNEEEKKLSEQLWEFERDAQIEELTRMKMQIQQLHMEREKMEARLDYNSVQVTAIEDVLVSRGDADLKQLQQILTNADVLKESMLKGELERDALFQDEDRRSMATRIIEEAKGEGSDDAFKLSDEVEMRRRKERETKRQERQERLRQLNEQRRKINEEQMVSVRKEKDHRLLMERGLELLVDIELGVAPPLKYILENAEGRDGDDEIVVESDIESDEERETFLSTVQHHMDLIPKIIESLEHEREDLEKEKEWAQGENGNIEPYAGELGPRSYHPDQLPTFRICISIVEDLAKKVTERLVHRPTIKDVNREVQNFDHMKKQRERSREEERVQRVVRAMHNELTSEIVHDLAGSICVEYQQVHERAKASTKDLLIEAFDVSASTRPMLMPVLSELIKRREVTDEAHNSRIAHHATKLKVGKKTDLKKRTNNDNDDNDQNKEAVSGDTADVDEVDYDTSLLPDTDVFPHKVRGDQHLVEMEDDYWDKFSLQWEGHNFPPKAGPATVACLSGNNRFMFTGHHKGAVLFWDLAHDEPLLVRQDLRDQGIPKSDLQEVTHAKFGSGGGGMRVVALDKIHVIRVWTTEVDASGNSGKKNNNMFPKDYHLYAKKPKAPQLICVLRAKNFARPGQDPEDLTTLDPTCIEFHSAMTITGQTPSILCGLRGGVIVKCNLNSDGPVLFNEPMGADVLNPVTKGKTKGKEERQANSSLRKSGNDSRPSTEREFFQAHRNEIEFIGNIGTSKDSHDPASKIVSVDKTGRIMVWPYSKESYSGFGWFIPSAKYKLRQKYEGGDKPMKLSMLEVMMNVSRTQLLLLVHASKMVERDSSSGKDGGGDSTRVMTGETGDLEIFIFDLHSGDFVPRTITVDAKSAMTKTPPAMVLAPVIDPLGSDYCFIVHGGIIRIISMNTNHVVRDEAKSIPKSQRSKMDVSG